MSWVPPFKKVIPLLCWQKISEPDKFYTGIKKPEGIMESRGKYRLITAEGFVYKKELEHHPKLNVYYNKQKNISITVASQKGHNIARALDCIELFPSGWIEPEPLFRPPPLEQPDPDISSRLPDTPDLEPELPPRGSGIPILGRSIQTPPYPGTIPLYLYELGGSRHVTTTNINQGVFRIVGRSSRINRWKETALEGYIFNPNPLPAVINDIKPDLLFKNELKTMTLYGENLFPYRFYETYEEGNSVDPSWGIVKEIDLNGKYVKIDYLGNQTNQISTKIRLLKNIHVKRPRDSPVYDEQVLTIVKGLWDDEATYLAHRFRPYFKFSIDSDRQEKCRPCTWEYFYKNSNLFFEKWIVDPNARPNLQLRKLDISIGTNYSQVLNYSDLRHVNEDTYDYNININDEAKQGQEWADAKRGDGFYFHATWISEDMLNLEYWVLFGFNDRTRGRNHKGDIICVQMVYYKPYDKIIRVSYSIHGQCLEAFDIPLNPKPIPLGLSDTLDLSGTDFNGREITQSVKRIFIYEDDACQVGPASWGYDGAHKEIFFAHDPLTGAYEHLVAFLEWGSHEPWPNESGSVSTAANHNGEGYSFLPDHVTNLVTDNDYHYPFRYFGGTLGDPRGIMMHRSWYLSNTDPYPRKLVDKNPYEQLKLLKWPPEPH